VSHEIPTQATLDSEINNSF
jgi:hypothetical protein